MKALAGNKEEFVNNECKVVAIGEKRILVWRSDKEFYATNEACPHQGASLKSVKLTGTLTPSNPKDIEHGMEGYVLRCPWHKWEFDVRTGKVLYGTDTKRVGTYPVIVEDDHVYVKLK